MIPFVVCGWVHHMLAALDPEGYPVTVATNPFTDFVDCWAKRHLFYSEASRVRCIA